MDDILKMDVFFFVTTVAVVFLTVLIAYAIYRFLRFLETLERIAKVAEREAEHIREDMQELRAKAKKEGLKLRHLVKFLGGFGKKN